MPDPTEVTVREPHKRIRLKGFEVTQQPDGGWVGRVGVAWHPGSDFVGTAERPDSPQAQLRCAAEATARALEGVTRNKVALQVLAVKAIEGFDTVLVVVSFEALDLAERLVGSCLIKERPSRAAALAVLHATNRLLGTVAPVTARDPETTRQLPDDFVKLVGTPVDRVTELVSRYWMSYPPPARAELAQLLLTLFDPLLQSGAQVTDELRHECEGAVTRWIASRQPNDIVRGS